MGQRVQESRERQKRKTEEHKASGKQGGKEKRKEGMVGGPQKEERDDQEEGKGGRNKMEELQARVQAVRATYGRLDHRDPAGFLSRGLVRQGLF